MTPSERVRRLVEAGTVSPDEGERLLAAMGHDAAPSGIGLLLNPFHRYGGGIAVGLGALVSASSVLIARRGIRFDGLLDIHVVATHPPTLRLALLDQCVAWLLPSLLLWACARVFTRHVRALDFLGAVGVARFPLFVAALPAYLLAPHLSPGSTRFTPALAAVVVVGVLALAHAITLLYQGFKNASGLRGTKLVLGLLTVIVVGEVLAKVFLGVVG